MSYLKIHLTKSGRTIGHIMYDHAMKYEKHLPEQLPRINRYRFGYFISNRNPKDILNQILDSHSDILYAIPNSARLYDIKDLEKEFGSKINIRGFSTIFNKETKYNNITIKYMNPQIYNIIK